MKYWLIDKIFNKPSETRHVEYLTMDRNFKILDISEGVQRFADSPQEVGIAKDVREGFPELIGVEDILIAVIEGKQDSFEYKGIARFSNRTSPLYIDLYAIGDEDEKSLQKRLLVFFEDVTQKMVLEQNLVQKVNELHLLSSALTASKNYIDKIIKGMADALFVTNSSGIIKTANQAAQYLFEYSEAELIGQPLSKFIAEENIFWQTIQRNSLPPGEFLKDLKVVCQTKTQKKIVVSFSCSTVETEIEGVKDLIYIGRDITERLQAEAELRYQQEQTERLLLNILPQPIAERLKQEQSTIAENFGDVTVMFADIVGFTELSSIISPTELVEMLNVIFSKFDELAEKHDLEKIKTIGDAYMVVGGLPVPRSDHAIAIAEMALDMQAALIQFSAETGKPFRMRIGINTGAVVAGVIGTKKFIYDLWGDTVNIASRMESHSLPGKIQVTEDTYEYLRDRYLLEKRSEILVKGKGKMTTYFLVGRKDFSH